MCWKLNFLAFFVVALLNSAAAQSAAQVPSLPAALPPGGFGPQTKAVMGFHIDSMDAAPVKGAPFCATITTEHTQSFADGNRIHTSDNSTLCRDSEGRTRRDAALMLLGPAPQRSDAKLVTIIDPVAGFRYVLDPNEKVARRMPLPSTAGPNFASSFVARAEPRGDVMYQTSGDAGATVFVRKFGQDSRDEPAPASENLGDQTISGIHATGTRITTTIPAGQMGNDLPMLTTSERWYSPELKATVMTKHSDPWAGELKTEFTTVSTAEPDKSLFSVPSDYKIVDEKPGQLLVPPPLLASPLPTPR